ncbi:NADH dehydrogenase I chain G [Buchnera aphidicola (Cinara tujafilina)]|uniref:NADH-quinone oxidoreductase subunit G n=1 Tax=Buchnera aphidicola (Cinara tujafilina) TaxID=261317 RepID=F7WZ45_9GAMM|nr:NADH dehydrogenase I chain G [Buchnera aphidicola (Cinara tujafilina)]
MSLGFDIPYFCWHPALGSIGACRQCAIKIYKSSTDDKGIIVMSCMTSVQEGMIISITDGEVEKFRKNIIELMMLNHPHDCPVCAEGGSCHLQDMTVLNQHFSRRFRFEKRIFKNQFLGPLLTHEMNRCITCYRCVRYYNDYSGGKDFGVYGISNKIYFGRLKNGSLESEFSGNLIDVCPTGVFTDKTNKNNFYRKWDLQYTPSICHHCSIGCNISIGEKLGKICRIDNRYNKNINKYFLCDLGRFSYGYSNLKNRLKNPFQRIKNTIHSLNYSDAIKKTSSLVNSSQSSILGIGSVRASLESNIALYNLVGKNNFSNGMPNKLNKCAKIILKNLKNGGFNIPSISDIETYDVILIIGEDITQTAPRAALAVRQAINNINNNIKNNLNHKNMSEIPLWHSYAIQNATQHKKNKLFITSLDKTKLDDISIWSYYGSIKKQIELINFITEYIHDDTYIIHKKYSKSVLQKIILIAQSLMQAKKPLIISGTSYFDDQILKVAINIATRLKEKGLPVGLALFPLSVNSLGSILISDISLNDVFKRINNNNINTLIILENDLYRFVSYFKVKKLLDKVTNIIVIDHYFNQTVNHASIFLPCSNGFESSGTVINYESRAQRFFRAFIPHFYNSKILVLDSWRWLYAIKNFIFSFRMIEKFTLDNIIDLCCLLFPIFKIIKKIAPNSLFRMTGQKIARSSYRSSGRNASYNNKNSIQSSVPPDYDTMFTFSMEGGSVQSIKENFLYLPFSHSPGWNSGQSYYKSEKLLQNKKNSFYNNDLLFPNVINKDILYFSFLNKKLKHQKILESFTVVPYYFLLHSEELSQQYFKRLNKVNYFYVIINIKDALLLNLNQGDIIKFQFEMNIFNFPICLSNKLDQGLLGLPIGNIEIPQSIIGNLITNIQKKDA